MVLPSTNSHAAPCTTLGESSLRSRTVRRAFDLSVVAAEKVSRALVCFPSLNRNSSHTGCSMPLAFGTSRRSIFDDLDRPNLLPLNVPNAKRIEQPVWDAFLFNDGKQTSARLTF